MKPLRKRAESCISINFPVKKLFGPRNGNVQMRTCWGQDYLQTNLPKVYHGLIRKKCLDQVKERTGAYFKGLSPDIFSSLAAANFTKRICSLDYPLTISGSCTRSAARGTALLEGIPAVFATHPNCVVRKDYQWSDLIPKFYSVETIWAESAVVAFKECARFDILEEFDVRLLRQSV